MKILWLTWKDIQHPLAGGAEVVASELGKRLVAAGHELIFVTGGFANCQSDIIHPDGYRIIRTGNRYTVYPLAFRTIRDFGLDTWADLVVEEVNTMPFLSHWYLKQRRVLFVHMLTRKIWFHEMFFPLNVIGYSFAEPLFLRLLRKHRVITVSESTRRDLQRFGFNTNAINIISEGLHVKPLTNLAAIQKFARPTMLSLGAMRSMKRTLHQLQAFELAKQDMPDLQLKIAGQAEGRYAQKILKLIKASPFTNDIEYLGRVSTHQKEELMQRSHVIVVTSVKEGWGLIVTEAASQGTPAVVYDVDGLRDSVRHNQTGLVTAQNPASLARAVIDLLTDPPRYEQLRHNAWSWSKTITFDKAFKDFQEAVLI